MQTYAKYIQLRSNLCASAMLSFYIYCHYDLHLLCLHHFNFSDRTHKYFVNFDWHNCTIPPSSLLLIITQGVWGMFFIFHLPLVRNLSLPKRKPIHKMCRLFHTLYNSKRTKIAEIL